MNDEGVCFVRYSNPYDVGEVIERDCELLSFDEIMDIFSRVGLLSIQHLERYPDLKENTLEVYRIAFGYMAVRQPDDVDAYYYVPVWDFYGHRVLYGTGGYAHGKEFGKIWGCSELTINAIDGTVIDRRYSTSHEGDTRRHTARSGRLVSGIGRRYGSLPVDGPGEDSYWLLRGGGMEPMALLAGALAGAGSALALPILAALPAAGAALRELSAGAARMAVFRCGRGAYIAGKLLAALLSAALSQAAGCLIFTGLLLMLCCCSPVSRARTAVAAPVGDGFFSYRGRGRAPDQRRGERMHRSHGCELRADDAVLAVFYRRTVPVSPLVAVGGRGRPDAAHCAHRGGLRALYGRAAKGAGTPCLTGGGCWTA